MESDLIGLFLFTAEEYREARNSYEELREEVIHEETDDYVKIDFEKLRKINPDIVAWL